MAKRRHGQADEILLVPFLDILCSLIGVLILIIVVLVVAQSQQTNGRTQEEVDRAIKYKILLKQQKELEAIQKDSTQKLAALNQQKKELEEKEQKAARLRKLLSSSSDVAATNKELSQNLLKELDNLLLEVEGQVKQQAETQKEIAVLNEEIKKRKPPATAAPPPVVVQPGGSGGDKNSKLYFVEASGGKIVIYWDQDKKTVVGATPEIIVADKAYQSFLTSLMNNKDAKIVFLIRSDGLGAYNNAAGWAMETYKFEVGRIGKLPIPGTGAIDLREFKGLMGTLPPPPEAQLVGSPPPAPAPAPSPPAPAAPAKAAPPAGAPPAAPAKPATPAPAAPAAPKA